MSKKYERARKDHLKAIQLEALVELPGKPTVVEIVDALVDGNHHARAAEFLFGTNQRGIPSSREHHLMFMQLYRGKYSAVVKAIARNHTWLAKQPVYSRSLFPIEVYPGEWLVIRDPAARLFRDTVPLTMFTPWGKKLGPEIPHAKEFRCLQCDYSFFGFESGNNHVVGYDRAYEGNVMIYECPRCFELCWYHASNFSLLMAAGNCPQWPAEEKI